MLLELHVRNFALIEKADLLFRSGLTVLTGETGAGKSILIDSIGAALGAKTGKDAIRTGAAYAYIELLFSVSGEERIKKMKELGTEPDENGTLIVSRKIYPNRTVMRVNDEAVTAATLKKLTELLIDIHGQSEHQTLLYPSMHLRFVDLLSPERLKELKKENAAVYEKYAALEKLLESGSDKTIREREAEILRYEVKEITDAALKAGEEEKLRAEYAKIRNAAKIAGALSRASESLDTDAVSRAVRAAAEVSDFDPALKELEQQLSELDGLLSDARRSISDYSAGLSYDGDRFEALTERLDLIHRLQDKYGDDIAGIIRTGEEKAERLAFLDHFEEERQKLLKEKKNEEEKLSALSAEISAIRKKTAQSLKERIREQLLSLNFPGVNFDIAFTELKAFGPNGKDGAEFLISTNPGEPLKPLRNVASGGELSRIMLAFKTVLADTDEIETLIFDEIDSGISGRTAQKVSEKLSLIGTRRQVLCISHLAQIAAMADHHVLILKKTDGISTHTAIREIEGKEITEELVRLIGGSEITPAVTEAAEEMKKLADRTKEAIRQDKVK